jgi:hypothetical protein
LIQFSALALFSMYFKMVKIFLLKFELINLCKDAFNKVILNSVMIFWITNLSACDVCGGSAGSPSFGTFVPTNFHQIGLRSSFRDFNSYFYGIEYSRETIFQEELHIRWQLHKRIQLIGSVPFQYARQTKGGYADRIQGMADPSVLTNVVLINKTDSVVGMKQFLSAGFGLKLPLGETVIYSDPQKNMYPGTGTTDLIFITTFYDQFSSKWGIQSEASYVWKGTDKWGYRFGNSLSMNAVGVRKFQKGKYRWLATTGFQFEQQAEARLNKERTEAQINNILLLSARVGVNLIRPNWMFSAQFQQPLIQQINEGIVRQKYFASVGVFRLIQKKKT